MLLPLASTCYAPSKEGAHHALAACSGTRTLIESVGEQTTGACIGTYYPRLPCNSRLRLRRRGYVDPAELQLCTALRLAEVSPISTTD